MSDRQESDRDRCEVVVNGEARTVVAATSLNGLVESLGLHPGAVAVELNGLIVKRALYSETTLSPGDRVEVVRFVQGGEACSPPS